MSETVVFSAAKVLYFNGHEWKVYELDSQAWYRPDNNEITQFLHDSANRDRKE